MIVINRRIIEQLLFMLYLCLSYDGVRGRKLPNQDDLELEKRLKLLNKPAIKTIKTEFGDIYDCVDFYKQPAFDHPLLKNHNYHPQMKSSLFVEKSDSTILTRHYKLPRIGLSDGGCPIGTVPIRRITKKDLIRHKLMPPAEDVMVDGPLTHRENSIDSKRRRYKPLQGYKIATVHTDDDNPNNKFGGASMSAGVYNPRVEGQQHSACRLKIIKGSNILQAGWRIDPTLYGDNNTRLYIHFDDGTNSCFNLLCPAFVLINTEIAVDSIISPVSQPGVKTYDLDFYLNWDINNGNWWLFITNSHTPIGFWPKEVFDDFAYFATRVEFGGVVYSPPGIIEPPMGSGSFPVGNTTRDGYCRNITILSDKGKNIDIGKLKTHVDSPNLYNAVDVENAGADWKHMVLYGGPGGF